VSATDLAEASGLTDPSDVAERLRALLEAEGGLLADLLAPPAESDPPRPGPAQTVAAGPRVGARGAEYALLVEAIHEGYLLHYGRGRLLRSPDADLLLLAGDRLYALGLARLAAVGDLPAVCELADVISLTALAHASGRPELAEAVWEAGAHAVGRGPSEAHARAKALVRAGAPEALEAMRALASV
jgi:hypothetical protein